MTLPGTVSGVPASTSLPEFTWEGVAEFTLGELLEESEALLRRYLIFNTDSQIVASVLWIAHTYVIDAFDVTPYLAITSAEPGSGKTRLLELLELLCHKPSAWIAPSEATLFHCIQKYRPTLLIDETDAIFHKARGQVSEGLRAIINAGYRRGKVVPRMVRVGDTHEDIEYQVFCPKALAGIGEMPATITDRSIPIRMRRRLSKTEHVERFTWPEGKAIADALCKGFKAWSVANVETFRNAKPYVPYQLNDRAAECWWPLMAIAEAADGEWVDRATAAALDLHAAFRDAQSEGVLLLRAIADIFKITQAPRLASVSIIDYLDQRDDAPWHDILAINPLKDPAFRTPVVRLAAMLKPYGVRPKTMRNGEAMFKGYDMDDFKDAFAQFLTGGAE